MPALVQCAGGGSATRRLVDQDHEKDDGELEENESPEATIQHLETLWIDSTGRNFAAGLVCVAEERERFIIRAVKVNNRVEVLYESPDGSPLKGMIYNKDFESSKEYLWSLDVALGLRREGAPLLLTDELEDLRFLTRQIGSDLLEVSLDGADGKADSASDRWLFSKERLIEYRVVDAKDQSAHIWTSKYNAAGELRCVRYTKFSDLDGVGEGDEQLVAEYFFGRPVAIENDQLLQQIIWPRSTPISFYGPAGEVKFVSQGGPITELELDEILRWNHRSRQEFEPDPKSATEGILTRD